MDPPQQHNSLCYSGVVANAKPPDKLQSIAATLLSGGKSAFSALATPAKMLIPGAGTVINTLQSFGKRAVLVAWKFLTVMRGTVGSFSSVLEKVSGLLGVDTLCAAPQSFLEKTSVNATSFLDKTSAQAPEAACALIDVFTGADFIGPPPKQAAPPKGTNPGSLLHYILDFVDLLKGCALSFFTKCNVQVGTEGL